jgi:glyoxylase-like metal-dependent hydrolase (beta-lactamase superfamily II)
MSTVGRLGDRAAVRSLRFGDVVATYVVDGVIAMRPPVFFPGIPDEYWAATSELRTAAGDLLMSAGGLLVEREGHTLLIDAGVGAVTADFSFGRVDCGALVQVLDDLGRRADTVDVLAFTHLHFDHAGWAFADGARTFPNARYVLSAKEWAVYADRHEADDAITPSHVIKALTADPSGIGLFTDGDEIAPGVRAVVTPGHTPGHTSYVITSGAGQRLVVFGDVFHLPAQLAHPDWLSVADRDVSGMATARRRLLDELLQPHTLGFGFHFGDQPFGRVTEDDDGEAIWEPVATEVLAPPPR